MISIFSACLFVLRLRRHRSAMWNEVLVQNLDKIGREEANHAPVTAQTTHPPQAISSVQTLNEITLNETQIVACFSSPRVDGTTPTRKLGRKRGWIRSHRRTRFRVAFLANKGIVLVAKQNNNLRVVGSRSNHKCGMDVQVPRRFCDFFDSRTVVGNSRSILPI